MNGNRPLISQTIMKILALQHAGHAVFRGQLDDVVAREFIKPFAVVANFGFRGIENLENLFEIGF